MLDVSSAFLFGTLPATLDALPLRNASFADNFFVGAVPPRLALLPGLNLDKNSLNSSLLPATGACPLVCASSLAFACPVVAAAACGCAPSCYNKCPVALTAANFSGIANTCADPSTACVSCTTAAVSPILLGGIALSDGMTQAACISQNTGNYIAAGANPAALDMLRYCVYTDVSAGVKCPVTLDPNTAFSTYVAVAANECAPAMMADLKAPCTTCLLALQKPFLVLGVPPQFDVLSQCLQDNFRLIISAGILTTTFARLISCPAGVPPPSPPRVRGNDTVVTAAVTASVLGVAAVAAVAGALVARRRRRDAVRHSLPLVASSSSSGGDAVLQDLQDGSLRSIPVARRAGGGSLLVRNEDIVMGAMLGVGGFARVHAARWRGTAVACKVFHDLPLQQKGVQLSRSLLDSWLRLQLPDDTPSSGDEAAGAACERELLLLQSLRQYVPCFSALLMPSAICPCPPDKSRAPSLRSQPEHLRPVRPGRPQLVHADAADACHGAVRRRLAGQAAARAHAADAALGEARGDRRGRRVRS